MFSKKSISTNLIALAVCLIIALAYCAPAFQDKVLNSHDYNSWKYMAKPLEDYHKEHGGSIYWTNSMFSGMPSVTFYGGDSGNFFADKMFGANNSWPRPVVMFILAVLGFFTLTLGFRMHWVLRILSTLAFVFTSYNPILAAAGHDTKHIAISMCAGLIGSIFITTRRNLYLGLSLFTLFSTLFITSGHYQIVYYFVLCLPFIVVVEILHARKQEGGIGRLIKAALLMLVCGLLSLLPTAKSVMGTQNYTKYTMRGGNGDLRSKTADGKQEAKRSGLDVEYAFRWSNGIGETFSTLIAGLYGPMSPSVNVYGEGKTAEAVAELGLPPQQTEQLLRQLSQLPRYWGPQPFLSGPVYFGAAVFFLFILGMLVVKDSNRWWILACTIVMVILAWGKHFGLNFFLFDHLPGYNKFRTPSMALSLPQIFFPLLAALGLQKIFDSEEDANTLIKKLFISGGITVALIVGLGFLGMAGLEGANDIEAKEQLTKAFGGQAQAVSKLYSGIKADRAAYVQSDATFSLVVVLLAIGLVWFAIKNKALRIPMMGALALLCTADLWIQAKKIVPDDVYYVESATMEGEFAPRGVDLQIKKDPALFYRVHDLSTDPFNDAKPAMFHNLIGGYSPAKMQTYQDMITYHLSKNNAEVLNMLNCKYIILGNPGQERAIPRDKEACGNAWFVPQVKLVPDAQAEIDALAAPSLSDSTMKGDFVAKAVAIVREDQKSFFGNTTSFTTDSSAKLVLTKYALNELEYSSSNKNAGFAVFSDIYYKDGVKAFVDGKETPIVRTNYVLRGLPLTAGDHKIKFVVEPPGQTALHKVSSISSFLVIAVVLGLLFLALRKEKLA
ncbi:MAG: hypothetical protein RL660_1320 [Bacteroidota bacterium]|jgi:hypothetical protein